MFLLSSTSVDVDAGAIIGDCYGTSVDACAIYGVQIKVRSILSEFYINFDIP